MSETAVAEELQTTSSETTEPIASSDELEPASEQELATTGEEQEGEAQESTEPVVRTPQEIASILKDHDGDLIAAVADGLITKDEAKTFTSYSQSVKDKAGKVEARLNAANREYQTAAEALQQALNDPDNENLTERQRATLFGPLQNAVRSALGKIHTADLDVEFTTALAELKGGDDLVSQMAALADLPLSQKVAQLIPAIRDSLLEEIGSDPKSGWMKRSEHERLIKEKDQAIANLKKPAVKGNTTNGSTQSGAGAFDNITYETLLKMTDAEVEALPADVFAKATSGS